jgi:hypothetical protein
LGDPIRGNGGEKEKMLGMEVQIADCRYRPLNQTFDNYSPRIIGQTNKDYFIHEKWTDKEVKTFRRNIRRQNICVRHQFPFYSATLERKKISKEKINKLKELPPKEIEKWLKDVWHPDQDPTYYPDFRGKIKRQEIESKQLTN